MMSLRCYRLCPFTAPAKTSGEPYTVRFSGDSHTCGLYLGLLMRLTIIFKFSDYRIQSPVEIAADYTVTFPCCIQ